MLVRARASARLTALSRHASRAISNSGFARRRRARKRSLDLSISPRSLVTGARVTASILPCETNGISLAEFYFAANDEPADPASPPAPPSPHLPRRRIRIRATRMRDAIPFL